ncbi:DUF418 domain-containing protein [Pseudonocardia sp. HH130629-09]|uniref:DUF418 domain-containing protein n=1 Tax=Pseudonocardia sp. HH130629-09 TaxID=1641402 RepID=UPI0006CB6357|nr:DUF418 domain-containing protein [Pseudonocardia sp. HH130629-09]ALE84352.1 hypothetical protein XF36_15365 [Pseudonocardia sp. HH130629-09]
MRDVPVTGRAPAPDLARGAALLLIAVANAHTFVTHRGIGVRTYPLDPTGVDAWLAAVQLTLVDGRAYPLFALLFGYGIAGLARRAARAGAGPDQVLALVRRRGGALFAVGAAHAVLLWHGDFVAAYGLIAVVLAPVLVRGSTAVLVLTGVAATTLLAVLYAPVALTRSDAASASPSLVAPDVVSAAVERFGEWLFGNLLISAVGLAGAAVAGVLVARAGWLDDPARHRRALRRVAVAGIGAGVVGGLPLGLVAAGAWTPSAPVALVVGVLHAVTGHAAGAGYAALAGLVVARRTRSAGAAPGGWVIRALVALGRRSLSGYLAQSVAFVALFPAWTLGLGAGLPLWAATLCGAGVWLVTVVVAVVAGRRGHRGPAEVLLRRLTYGRTPAPAHRPAGP